MQTDGSMSKILAALLPVLVSMALLGTAKLIADMSQLQTTVALFIDESRTFRQLHHGEHQDFKDADREIDKRVRRLEFVLPYSDAP